MASRTARLTAVRRERVFYAAMALVIVALIVTGFARSYYFSRWFDTPRGTPEITMLLRVHGAVFTGWLALLVIQPLLVASGRIDWHRRVGAFGMALAAAMWLLGNLAAIAAIHVGYIGLGNPYAFYAIPFFDINLFGLLVGMAWWHRRNAAAHKRLILLGSTQVLEAGLARMPLAWWGPLLPQASLYGALGVIVAGIVFDTAVRGRPHRVWVWGGILLLTSNVARLAIMNTAGWLAFAHAMAAIYPP